MENKKRKMIEVNNEIYNDFVSECRKKGENIGNVLNELMNKFVENQRK